MKTEMLLKDFPEHRKEGEEIKKLAKKDSRDIRRFVNQILEMESDYRGESNLKPIDKLISIVEGFKKETRHAGPQYRSLPNNIRKAIEWKQKEFSIQARQMLKTISIDNKNKDYQKFYDNYGARYGAGLDSRLGLYESTFDSIWDESLQRKVANKIEALKNYVDNTLQVDVKLQVVNRDKIEEHFDYVLKSYKDSDAYNVISDNAYKYLDDKIHELKKGQATTYISLATSLKDLDNRKKFLNDEAVWSESCQKIYDKEYKRLWKIQEKNDRVEFKKISKEIKACKSVEEARGLIDKIDKQHENIYFKDLDALLSDKYEKLQFKDLKKVKGNKKNNTLSLREIEDYEKRIGFADVETLIQIKEELKGKVVPSTITRAIRDRKIVNAEEYRRNQNNLRIEKSRQEIREELAILQKKYENPIDEEVEDGQLKLYLSTEQLQKIKDRMDHLNKNLGYLDKEYEENNA